MRRGLGEGPASPGVRVRLGDGHRRENRMAGLELWGEIIFDEEWPPSLEAQCQGHRPLSGDGVDECHD